MPLMCLALRICDSTLDLLFKAEEGEETKILGEPPL